MDIQASVLWGLIGPARLFSLGQIYSGLLLFFVLGAVATIAVHLAGQRYTLAKHIIVPLVLGGAGSIPPATPLNYLSVRVTHPSCSLCHSDHESVVGYCGIRLPISNQNISLSLVESTELSDVFWSRPGAGYVDDCYICSQLGWCPCATMVGKYCIANHDGC